MTFDIETFVAAISVVPVIIGIITNATKLSDKKAMLKWKNHGKFKTLLTVTTSNVRNR